MLRLSKWQTSASPWVRALCKAFAYAFISIVQATPGLMLPRRRLTWC